MIEYGISPGLAGRFFYGKKERSENAIMPGKDTDMTNASEPSILIRMPNWLGDCVMAMPAVEYLHNAFPNARIHLAGREQFRELFSAQKGVAGFIPAPQSGFGKLLRSMSETRRIVKDAIPENNEVDLGLLFTNSLSTAAWMWRAGTRTRVGYDLDCRRFFLTHPVPCGEVEAKWHFVRYYLRLAKFAQAALLNNEGDVSDRFAKPRVEHVAPSVTVSKRAREEAQRLLSGYGVTDDYVVIAPASAYGEVKDWPTGHWLELVGKIREELGLRVVVTGSEGQKEACGNIADGNEGVVNVAGRTDMDVFAGLLAGAGGFVGGDSGGAHVAGALGIPSVVIFGITNPARTSPGGRAVKVLGGEVGGEVKLSTPEARQRARETLLGIRPQTVFEALMEVRRK